MTDDTVRVPREPTKEMTEAGWRATGGPNGIYRAMLSAAPSTDGGRWIPVPDDESLGAFLTGIPGKPIYAVDERTEPHTRWRFELPELPPAPAAQRRGE